MVGKQPDEPAAMSLRGRFSPQLGRPRKWPGSVAGRLYVGWVTTGVVSHLHTLPIREALDAEDDAELAEIAQRLG